MGKITNMFIERYSIAEIVTVSALFFIGPIENSVLALIVISFISFIFQFLSSENKIKKILYLFKKTFKYITYIILARMFDNLFGTSGIDGFRTICMWIIAVKEFGLLVNMTLVQSPKNHVGFFLLETMYNKISKISTTLERFLNAILHKDILKKLEKSDENAKKINKSNKERGD